ncbi:DNA-binding XRE family transcriptional regulator [Microvirgula sp. AG722]|uniref:helix-turn-helix domain-containing protein n=1 Tax=Microvirgula sp. AG722 TaxID=2183901 RepID=UPI000DC30179|nr:helix-turn-helix transcriptional regulator [Microvirgula sp. AG722]RAS10891.1 DNA-binding XRE family transcriptional regulator [Microvirgula sp. AG722]
MVELDMKVLAQRVGKSIARHRQAANLTQDEVAERLGIGNEAVSRIERGIVMPTVARLVELAQIFRCETADLLSESSNRPLDQEHRVSRLLSTLGAEDRELVVELVERLVSRLNRG